MTTSTREIVPQYKVDRRTRLGKLLSSFDKFRLDKEITERAYKESQASYDLLTDAIKAERHNAGYNEAKIELASEDMDRPIRLNLHTEHRATAEGLAWLKANHFELWEKVCPENDVETLTMRPATSKGIYRKSGH